MEFIGIIIAAIVGMAIGFIWFGPLFGKLWIKLSKFSQEDMDKVKAEGMKKTYLLAFLTVLIMAWGLNALIANFASSMSEALRLGFLAWLAVVVPTMANSVLWEGKNKKLFLINIAERLVTILVMSAIVASL